MPTAAATSSPRNRLIDNQHDGIAVFESHDNIIAFNEIERNGGAGIRIRASAANIVAGNLISGNGEYGLVAYDRSESAQAAVAQQRECTSGR